MSSPYFGDTSLVASGYGGVDDDDDVIRGATAEIAAKERVIISLQEDVANLKR